MYLAVTAHFMALDDDERGSECALIPVTGACYRFTLHVFFLAGVSLRKSKLYFLKTQST